MVTDEMSDNPILRIAVKILIPLILLFALYVQFHGDFGPGGGFQAGVIFAAGVIVYGLVFGIDQARRVAPLRWLRGLASAGVLLYGTVGVVNLLLGGNFLEYGVLADDPVHGQHYGILLIELGVGITVASVILVVFLSFAGRGAD